MVSERSDMHFKLKRGAIISSIEDLFSDHIDLFLPSPNSQADTTNTEGHYVANPKYRDSSDAVAM